MFGYRVLGFGVNDPTAAAAGGIIESIQQIEFTVASSSATGTGTISAVDTANTSVFFSSGHAGGHRTPSENDSEVNSLLRVELTNGTTVTATRGAAPPFSITVVCTVVEWASAAVDSVQQGTVDITGAGVFTGTDTITTVDTSRSAVIYLGGSTTNSGIQYGGVYLTDATTITAESGLATANGTLTVGYVVVEFAAGVTDSVEQFDISITNAANTTNTATITSVDTSRSFIFPGGATNNDTGPEMDDAFTHAQLTNGTTVTITRNTADAVVPNQFGTVVQFDASNITSIQRGVVTLSSTTLDTTVTEVSATLSMVNALGATSTDGSNIDPDKQYFTAEIQSTTNIRLTKGSSSRNAITSYELVEFA